MQASRKRPRTSVVSRTSTLYSEVVRVVAREHDLVTANKMGHTKRPAPVRNMDSCVYCGAKADTLDHLFSVIQNGVPSGYGHSDWNLVPCCSTCNSKKGSKHWRHYMHSLSKGRDKTRAQRARHYDRIKHIETWIAQSEATGQSHVTCTKLLHPFLKYVRSNIALYCKTLEKVTVQCVKHPQDWRQLVKLLPAFDPSIMLDEIIQTEIRAFRREMAGKNKE